MTADWAGTPPYTASRTWARRTGSRWGSRKVRPDGTVRWMGRIWRVSDDTITKPEPGEWLLLCDYGPDFRPTCYEWTAPADPDGFLRRMFWVER